MPGATYTVFQEMRPPIAVDDKGGSPLRTKKGKQVFSLAESPIEGDKNPKATRNQIIKNQTDDGRLCDLKWNKRHYVHPSAFNTQNKSYFQVNHIQLTLDIGIL